MEKEWEKAQRAAERAALADERERKRLYQEARALEVDSLNADIEARLDRLEGSSRTRWRSTTSSTSSH
jgi:restriction system protein